MLYLEALYTKYKSNSYTTPKAAEIFTKYLKFAKDFPTKSSKAVIDLGAGGAVAEDFAKDLTSEGFADILKDELTHPTKIVEIAVDTYYKMSNYDLDVVIMENYRPCGEI